MALGSVLDFAPRCAKSRTDPNIKRNMNEQQLAQLIYQTYEATPHTSAARLSQIEQTVVSGMPLCAATSHPRRSRRLTWWMAGLVLMAGAAAAWWAINRHETDAPAPLQDTSKELSMPSNNGSSTSGQALNSQPRENTDARAQEVVKNPHESPPPPSSAQAHDEKSTVIYKR